MKLAILISVFSIGLSSCSNPESDIYGKWMWGEESQLELEISPNNTLTFLFDGQEFIDNQKFKFTKSSNGLITIESETTSSDSCFIYQIEFLNDHSCLIANTKCHIDKNMIDEVVLAKKNRSVLVTIPKPEQQIIQLSDEFRGEFFIVYVDNEDYSNMIEITESKFAYSNNIDFKQLYNSNRRVEYQNKIIPILNPNQYGKSGIDFRVLDNSKNSDLFIIQHGFNQSPRDTINESLNKIFNNSINIEYFELLSAIEIIQKYDL